MAADFSVSREGIQLPYRRFLADTAAGFILILLVCLAHYSLVPGIPRLIISSGLPLPTEVKVFALVVLFVLATPIGFVINAVGWFVMEQPIAVIERAFFDSSLLERGSFSATQVAVVRRDRAVREYFGVDRNSFATAAWFLRDILEAYVPERVQPHHHVRGLIIFMQNLTFLVLALGLFSLGAATSSWWGNVAVSLAAFGLAVLMVGPWTSLRRPSRVAPATIPTMIGVLTVAAFCTAVLDAGVAWPLRYFAAAATLLLLAAAVSFYQHLASLAYAYVVCCEYGIDPHDPCVESDDRVLELVRRLVQQVRKEDQSRKVNE